MIRTEARPPIILASREDFEALLSSGRPRMLPGRGRIVVEIEKIDADEKRLLERKLNRYFYDCGCASGAIASSLAMVSAIIYLVAKPGGIFGVGWADIGCSLLFILLSAALGKGLGISLAGKNLKKTVRGLLNKPFF